MKIPTVGLSTTRSKLCLLLLAGCGLPAQAAAQCAEPSVEQRAMADEINLARTQPAIYADIIARHFTGMREDGLYQEPTGRWVKTREGQAAVDEAVAYLRAAAPMPALPLHACLSQAADDHIADAVRSRRGGHIGSDGSRPSERASRRVGVRVHCGENISYGRRTAQEHMIALIVDDGVASRGHRDNLFAPRYRSLGVGVGERTSQGYMTVHMLCMETLPDHDSAHEAGPSAS